MVAVKSNVCRPCEAFGRTSIQIDNSSAKDGSSNRSASSRTKNLHRLNPPVKSSPEDDMIRSANRPGVATTICGR